MRGIFKNHSGYWEKTRHPSISTASYNINTTEKYRPGARIVRALLCDKNLKNPEILPRLVSDYGAFSRVGTSNMAAMNLVIVSDLWVDPALTQLAGFPSRRLGILLLRNRQLLICRL